MTGALAAVWGDLRERRLWPVAVLLVAAIVAVPFVMRAPAREPATPQAGVAPAKAAQPAVLTEAPPAPSRLEVFDPKDPFRPAIKRREATPAGPGSKSSSSGDSGAAALPKAAGAGGASTGSTDGVAKTGSSGGGSSSGGGGGSTTTKLYTHTVDVRVGVTGRERLRRGVKRLTMLPSEENPLFVFLGVDVSGKEAVFLIDGDLSQSGEGECDPSPDRCSFLTLTLDPDQDEHFFAAEDGTEYTLELVDIDQVEVKDAARSSRAAAARSSKRARRARSSALGRFVSPIFGDVRRERRRR